MGPVEPAQPPRLFRQTTKNFCSIDTLARAYAVVPPAGFAIGRAVIARRMMVATEGGTNQHSIRGGTVERSIGFKYEFKTLEYAPTLQIQRRIKLGSLWRDHAHRIRGQGACHRVFQGPDGQPRSLTALSGRSNWHR